MTELDKIVAVMVMVKDLIQRREVLEGYEITIDKVKLYIGRYFGQMNYAEWIRDGKAQVLDSNFALYDLV